LLARVCHSLSIRFCALLLCRLPNAGSDFFNQMP
jgi:hypothetical protein